MIMSTIKITNARVEVLVASIKSLSAKSNNNVAFKFKNAGRTTYNLAKTLEKAEIEWKSVLEKRNEIIKGLLPTPEARDLEGKAKNTFLEEYQGVLDAEVDLEIRTVKLSDLDLDNNPGITPEILSGLGDVVLDDLADAPDSSKKV